MKKRGGIWISAILYMAMGIVILSIILAVGLPAINKMKDSYNVRQTKELMIGLDDNIRNVYHEGPGSQRIVNLEIGRGDFVINPDLDIVTWEIESSAILSELNVPVKEGNLEILTNTTNVEGKYGVKLTLDYLISDLNITYDGPQELSGSTKLSILNKGGEPVIIAITQI